MPEVSRLQARYSRMTTGQFGQTTVGSALSTDNFWYRLIDGSGYTLTLTSTANGVQVTENNTNNVCGMINGSFVKPGLHGGYQYESGVNIRFELKGKSGGHIRVGVAGGVATSPDTYGWYAKTAVFFDSKYGLIVNVSKTTNARWDTLYTPVDTTDVDTIYASGAISGFTVDAANIIDITLQLIRGTYTGIRIILRINGEFVLVTDTLEDSVSDNINEFVSECRPYFSCYDIAGAFATIFSHAIEAG